ncbi:hypothetical protein ABZ366_12930 [Streptomyces sp. NPDC005904]|uniref:hypothetical protein n=1 Tax=Streptomyces sp. NPDC005904 TaxID=3154570 RepID=UPI003404624B
MAPAYVVIGSEARSCAGYRHPIRAETCADAVEVPFGVDLLLTVAGREVVVRAGGFSEAGEVG